MTWINLLIKNQIKHYIYKIPKGDSIILKPSNQIIIILSGISYMGEIFINKEISPLAILSTNNIFNNNNSNRKVYYKITALETTYLLSINRKTKNTQIIIDQNIAQYYLKTSESYKIINTIMKQKYILNRVTQLLLILCFKFGYIKGDSIFIPFQLSSQNIAILTGTSKNTITKITNKIYKTGIINKIYKNIISISKITNVNLE
uniref:Global nitrogen transcriptional regulator n=1 Tax=Herposiphonia versicolor TaxID=2007163 RepID=A0A1Z1MFJ0_9FLOR|nr:global nitrogen transcriptional regulator [Herposiphonia versicolor]ARW64858.1 global nitrogen transcriptional regulator [Herposiphonia versicolor]